MDGLPTLHTSIVDGDAQTHAGDSTVGGFNPMSAVSKLKTIVSGLVKLFLIDFL